MREQIGRLTKSELVFYWMYSNCNTGDFVENNKENFAGRVKVPVRKDVHINLRLERALALRLQAEAERSTISTSDKIRRILDAALPNNQ